MIERIKEVNRKFKKMDLETINAYITGLFFIVVVDVIGIWYFLELKKVAMAILIVSMGVLTILLINKSKKEVKMLEEQEEQEEEEETEEEEEEKPKKVKKTKKKSKPEKEEGGFMSGGFMMPGLLDSDEYNKRFEEATKTF